MIKEKEKVEIGYRIVKIHTAMFSYQEVEDKNIETLFNGQNMLTINMNITLNIDKEKSSITIDVTTELIENANEKVLIEHSGRTIYQVKGLEGVHDVENDQYDIPDELLIQLYSIAYSHSRALLATEISPTMYKDKYFLPVINPSELIKKK